MHRVAHCGRVRTGGAPVVALGEGGTAHMRGLQTCGSIAVCPVCSAKIRHARAVEIDEALAVHLEAGGGAQFLTLTVPHDRAMALADLWDAVSKSWAYVVSGRVRQELRDNLGPAGFIRATEATHGANGWHCHLHVALLTERPLDLDTLRELGQFFPARWDRRVMALGYRKPSLWHGVRLLPVFKGQEVGAYLSKVDDQGEFTPGAELARLDLKDGRRTGSRSPFAVLADCVDHGRERDWRIFEEWTIVSKGRRTLEWSRGLRALLLGTRERTDDEIAAETEPATPVAAFDPPVWSAILERGLDGPVLEAVEAQGLGGLVVLLRAAGMDVEVRAGPPPLVIMTRDPVLL